MKLKNIKPKTKQYIIQTVALVIGLLLVGMNILYARGDFDFTFITRPDESTDETSFVLETETTADTTDDEAERKTLAQYESMSYEEAMATYKSLETATSSGKKLSSGLYSYKTSTLALVSENKYGAAYSNRKYTSNYGSDYEQYDRPTLITYYGYILYDNGTKISLLDSTGKMLLDDISGYVPVGYTDLAGNPLFINSGSYYYFYNKNNPNPYTVFASDIKYPTKTAEESDSSQTSATTTAPGQNTTRPNSAMPTDPLELSSVIGKIESEAPAMPDAGYYIRDDLEVTEKRPSANCMVAEMVNTDYLNTIMVNSIYEQTCENTNIYRLAYRQVTNQNEIDQATWQKADQEAQLKAGTLLPSDKVDIVIPEPTYSSRASWGYFNRETGSFTISPRFGTAYDFSRCGYAIVNSGSNMRIINTSGTLVGRTKAESITLDTINVTLTGDYYLPTSYGAQSIGTLRFSGVNTLTNYVLYKGKEQYSAQNVLVFSDGTRLATPKGYEITAYADQTIVLKKDGKYGMMDKYGAWIAQPIYNRIDAPSEGLVVIANSDGKYGMIDTQGTIVLPFVYDYISSSSNGVVVAFAYNHGWSVFNKCDTTVYTPQENGVITLLRAKLLYNAYSAYLKKYTDALDKLTETTTESTSLDTSAPETTTEATTPATTAPVTTTPRVTTAPVTTTPRVTTTPKVTTTTRETTTTTTTTEDTTEPRESDEDIDPDKLPS